MPQTRSQYHQVKKCWWKTKTGTHDTNCRGSWHRLIERRRANRFADTEGRSSLNTTAPVPGEAPGLLCPRLDILATAPNANPQGGAWSESWKSPPTPTPVWHFGPQKCLFGGFHPSTWPVTGMEQGGRDTASMKPKGRTLRKEKQRGRRGDEQWSLNGPAVSETWPFSMDQGGGMGGLGPARRSRNEGREGAPHPEPPCFLPCPAPTRLPRVHVSSLGQPRPQTKTRLQGRGLPCGLTTRLPLGPEVSA